MQNKVNQGRKVVSPVLNRVGDCGHRRHTSNQPSLECLQPLPPHPPPPTPHTHTPGAQYGLIVFSFWIPGKFTIIFGVAHSCMAYPGWYFLKG